MTFSICVRESCGDHDRFGVAVTTRMPGIGDLSPFVSQDGAVAIQGHVTGALGPRIIELLAEDYHLDDVIRTVLSPEVDPENRQIHGVDRNGPTTYTGEACNDWSGHRVGETYSVAGNLLESGAVLDAMADSYEHSDRSERLAKRLIDALEAGEDAGGDHRDLDIQSAALRVFDPEAPLGDSYYNDLRTNATWTPLADLRERYELGLRGREIVASRYGWD
ncbi:DUF1028 domain-containing protein [Haloarchaeobius sp. DYHT-AS-18]|uniref:DUF1028 domain-containing protein n=1 Tax=Haloarchaeobius sp. DYHT-AS-18 TaxID=3446117 RepID=UPI003EB6CB8F